MLSGEWVSWLGGSREVDWAVVWVQSIGQYIDYEGEGEDLVFEFLGCCFVFAHRDLVELLV